MLFVIFTLISAFWNLVSPHAHASFSVVGKSGAALIARSFTIPAVPEDVAFSVVSEDTI